MTLLQENIEYTFNINKLYFNLDDDIIAFDYELRMFLGENAIESEISIDHYIFKTPIKKFEDIMTCIINGIKKDENIDDIEYSSIFITQSNLLKTRKTSLCSFSLTNIV